MTKASLIRSIVSAGFTGKSPNTLRRWSLEALQGLLASLTDNETFPGDGIDIPGERVKIKGRPWGMQKADYCPPDDDSGTLPHDPANVAMTPHVVSEDMEAYVASVPVMPAPVSVPSDRELYVLSLRHDHVETPRAESPLNRWLALALAPWTFLTQVCGIA
jgi:hypothetical protein